MINSFSNIDNLEIKDCQRVSVTLKQGDYKRGDVLGKVTADREFRKSLKTSTDGSENPLLILSHNPNRDQDEYFQFSIEAGKTEQVGAYISGKVNSSAIDTSEFTVAELQDALIDRFIFTGGF